MIFNDLGGFWEFTGRFGLGKLPDTVITWFLSREGFYSMPLQKNSSGEQLAWR